MNRILIESQWNLKSIQYLCDYYGADILIESQWNLKVKPGSRKNCRVRHINRITVEFKIRNLQKDIQTKNSY